ncbi:MAG TPA: glycosyltransferase family 4 protein [Vicinamibacteria bacterium]|nr:glycosyltransferase family 4 protein [Vicinamibacteria bacterium]
MKILSITAGAANMYCGSCLRDNALAAELMRQGHEVTLVPIYTPTRTDEDNVSESRVLFGGINVYLQQNVPIFRRTPGFVDRLFDAGWLMNLLGRLSFSTDPGKLGALTISTLRGEDGFQRKEVLRLVSWLKAQPPPDVVVLPNSLLIGLAPSFVRSLGRPIVCTLQGEDLFLDGLTVPERNEALELIRRHVEYVDGFVAVSHYYADYMGRLLSIPREKMAVVPLGINFQGYEPAAAPEKPLSIGYFARVAPEKGLHNLCEAYRLLRSRDDLPETRLRVAGYLGRQHRSYLAQLTREMGRAGLSHEFHYHGVLGREEKIDFLRSLAVVSVPTDYDEPKGLFVLEAMACGVPVVQPDRGAFPELVSRTGGGRLVRAGDPRHLAESLADLLLDSEARRELGRRAATGVRRHYSVEQMATASVEVFERVIRREALGEREVVEAGALPR